MGRVNPPSRVHPSLSMKNPPTSWSGGSHGYRLLEQLAELLLEPVEVVGLVEAVDAAGSAAGPVRAEGRDAGDHERVLDEVRAARVAEAGPAALRVVGQQDGVV